MKANDDLPIFNNIAEELINIWMPSNIPTFQLKAVKDKVGRLVKLFKDLDSNFKKKAEQKDDWKNDKMKEPGKSLEKFTKLFDISKCGCYRQCTKPEQFTEEKCKCEIDCRISNLKPQDKANEKQFSDLEYYIDMRFDRKLFISVSIDANSTKKLNHAKRLKRKRNDSGEVNCKKKVNPWTEFECEAKIQLEYSDSSSSEPSGPSNGGSDFDPFEETNHYESQNKNNCKEYPKSTQTAWRHGLSLQGTADVINSFLEDQNNNCVKNGLPKMHDGRDFLSKRKVQNMRNRYGKEFVENHAQSGPYKCLGLDGKKGKVSEKNCSTSVLEKVTVIDSITKKYVDHFVPKNGTGIAQAFALHEEVIEKYSSESTLRSLNVDGCRVNTGRNNGMIKYVEDILNRSLQWIVCLLHLNELLLRHLFGEKDGWCKGPDAYIGPLGKLIAVKSGMVRTPLVNFQTIESKVEETDYTIDNNDTQLLYKLSHFVGSGHESQYRPVFDHKPGKVCQSRWVTTASNLLLLFCQTLNPTPNQIVLIQFIQGCYAPMIFLIKNNSHVTNGSRLFFEMVLLAKAILSANDFKIVKKVLQDNPFWAHPENILLSMVWDDDRRVRKKRC